MSSLAAPPSASSMAAWYTSTYCRALSCQPKSRAIPFAWTRRHSGGCFQASSARTSADAVHGTGFVMKSCDAAGLEDALVRALEAWSQPQLWRSLQSNGMARDFGWGPAAEKYQGIYRSLVPSP